MIKLILIQSVVVLSGVFALPTSPREILVNTKHAHTVPTYFRRQDKNGHLISRKDKKYGQEISFPIIEEISGHDRKAVLKAKPFFIKNGDEITVTWSGVENPNAKDWIAILCPHDDKIQLHLDHFFVDESPTWKYGYGSHKVHVFNMRNKCEFRYFRNHKGSYLVARSNKIGFEFGGDAPLQGRIAVTGKPTEMRVMWTAAKSDNHVVWYGTSKDKLDMEATGKSWTYKASDMCGPNANTTGFKDPGYMYDVLLTKLQPMTRYFYSYGSKGAMSPVLNFSTPFPSGTDKKFEFIVYGDMGVSTFPRSSRTAQLMLKEYHKNDAQFIFHIGDISYAEGRAYVWDQWHAIIEPYSTLMPYMVTMGNHEQDHLTGGEKDPSGAPGEGFHPYWGNFGDDSGGECGVPMYNRFHMPDNGNHLWWYSFDYGLVHMIAISTEHDYQPGTRQYKWLENDLKNVDRKKTPWVIIGGHRAMYSSQKILSDLRVSFGMQLAFEDLLYKYRVDVGVWGHYHSYERTCKVYRHECRDDGILHITVGTAGAWIDKEDYLKMPWSLYHERNYGYGRMTVVNATSLLYEWIRNEDDVMRDYVWLHK